jgi:hypothetical protein
MNESELLVGIVGPCKSGKSVLKKNLEALGFSCRHIAQEHSFAPKMWNLIGRTDVLIFLDVSFENTLKRGKLGWQEKDYKVQLQRLSNAKENADLIIDTNTSDEKGVLEKALAFLSEAGGK